MKKVLLLLILSIIWLIPNKVKGVQAKSETYYLSCTNMCVHIRPEDSEQKDIMSKVITDDYYFSIAYHGGGDPTKSVMYDFEQYLINRGYDEESFDKLSETEMISLFNSFFKDVYKIDLNLTEVDNPEEEIKNAMLNLFLSKQYYSNKEGIIDLKIESSTDKIQDVYNENDCEIKIVETSPLDGYIVDQVDHFVKPANQDIITIINRKPQVLGEVVNPKTGVSSNTLIIISLLALLLVVLIITRKEGVILIIFLVIISSPVVLASDDRPPMIDKTIRIITTDEDGKPLENVGYKIYEKMIKVAEEDICDVCQCSD